jgi:uncharacterized delta-60 repeat protein
MGRWALLAVTLGMLVLAGSALGTAGDLDPSFGSGGIATVFHQRVADCAGYPDPSEQAALRSDGKIVAMANIAPGGAEGDCGSGSGPDIGLALLNANGTPDTSFGGGTGMVDAGPGSPLALAVQDDNKILVLYGAAGGASDLTRLNADGSLDTSFGTNGTVQVATFNNQTGESDGGTLLGLVPATAPDGAGDIIVAGLAQGQGGAELGVEAKRYTPAGVLDSSYGNNGVALIPADQTSTAGVSIQDQWAMTVQDDGKAVVVGDGRNTDPNGDVVWEAVRLDVDGSADPTFGNGGVTALPFSMIGDTDGPRSVAQDASGNILLGGSGMVSAGDRRPELVRLNDDGSIDTTFGQQGLALTPNPDGGSAIRSTALQSDGTIDAVGDNRDSGNGSQPAEVAIWQFTPDGQPDSNFVGGGEEVLSEPLELNTVSMQSDDKPVAAGFQTDYPSADLAVLRFTNGSGSGSGGGGGGTGGGGGGGTGGSHGASAALLSTQTAVKMPNVLGLTVDDARARITDTGIYGQLKTVFKILRRPPKISQGGHRVPVRPFEVYSQSTPVGARVTSSAAHPKRVTLAVYVSHAVDNHAQANGCKLHGLAKGLKGLDLDEALQLLNTGGCHTVNLNLREVSGNVATPEVGGSRTKGDVLTIRVSSDPADYDLFGFLRQGVKGVDAPSVGEDGKLTVGQRNVFGVQVFNRANQKVTGATVLVDGSGVGSDDFAAKTADSGEAIVQLNPSRSGPVNVLVEEKDASGNGIFGFGQVQAIDRTQGTLVTIGGEVFRRRGGRYVLSGEHPAGDRGAGIADCTGLCAWWNGILSWFHSLGKSAPSGGSVQQQVASADQQGIQAAEWICPGDPAQGSAPQIKATSGDALSLGAHNTAQQGAAHVDGCQHGDQITAGTAARDYGGAQGAYLGAGGTSASGRGTLVCLLCSAGSLPTLSAGDVQKVISAGGGNLIELEAIGELVSAGEANVISAGGGNVQAIKNRVASVISAGGGNLKTLVVLAGVISAGGGNFVGANGSIDYAQIAQQVNKIITAGGGNAISATQVRNVITAGGGNLLGPVEVAAAVISAGGGNVISAGGGNLDDLETKAARVISAGGGNVISAGGGNLLSNGTIAYVISAGGGNLTKITAGDVGRVITAGGGNLNEIKAIGQVISAGGGNVISAGGGNLAASIAKQVNNVISAGGGNVITAGGGNMTVGLGSNLIAVSGLISDKGVG